MLYVRVIACVGGIFVVLLLLVDVVVLVLLALLAGVCLSGGLDFDPVAYGACLVLELGLIELVLDWFELVVVRCVDTLGLLIFGICCGAQVLNVVCGGTLH